MGTLEVKLCDGTLLKDVAWLGKQSPYCVLTIGAQTFRSVTHTHGGSTPVWNTFFHFKDVTADHVLHIQCYHEAMLPQHPLLEALALLGLKKGPERWLLGQCCVPLNEVPIHGSQEVRVLLFSRKGKGRGALRILLEFVLPAQAQQRDPEAAPVSGTQAHARRTPEERQGSSSGDMVPLPPALQLGRRLLDAVSQWPDQCLRLRHLELVRACLGHLQRSLVSTRWIQPSDVEILQQQPAEGGFAVVVQGAWKGRQVALKQFRPFHPASTIGRTLVQSFVREVCLLSQLRTAEQHDNIVGLLGFTADLEAGWLGIVLEWVGEGPAAALTVDRAAETATPQARLQYALDVVEGVRYLHSHTPCIVHRDLTSLNVLITPEGRAKLIDFGISQWLLRQGGTLSRNAALNPPWMPPEVLSGAERIKGLQVLSDCDEKCDVYSVGVILGQLATRTRPWAGMEENEVVQAFSGGARLGPPEVAQEWLGELISRCISEIPAARPDMEYVLHVLQSHQAEGILRSDAPWPVIWPECSGPS